MTVSLNHTIVWCRDSKTSARFMTEMLGLPDARVFGPFQVVDVSNEVSLDFHDTTEPIHAQHYAFLISEAEFDEVLGRIETRELDHWQDPACRVRGVNTNDGGRGTYFFDPDGHLLEVITRPYGATSS